MGEAKRRKILGLPPKKSITKAKYDESPRLFEWLPFTINQRDNLIKLISSDKTKVKPFLKSINFLHLSNIEYVKSGLLGSN